MEKAKTRKAINDALAALAAAERHAKSLEAAKHLLAGDEFKQAGTVMLFVSMHDELDTAELIDAAVKAGKRVSLPRIDMATRLMEAHEITNPVLDLAPGSYGILEPVTETIIPAAELDFILVPARGFSPQGHRLGRGAGYYDRYMSRPGFHAIKCGIAFDAQILDSLPVEPHDIPVDIVVTESRIVKCSSTG